LKYLKKVASSSAWNWNIQSFFNIDSWSIALKHKQDFHADGTNVRKGCGFYWQRSPNSKIRALLGAAAFENKSARRKRKIVKTKRYWKI